MKPLSLEKNDFLQGVFDAIPSPIFIVDDDVRILYLNPAAMKTFGLIQNQSLRMRGGEALHCIHSTETTEGCGRAESCQKCVIRNSVGEAVHGNKVNRKKTKMEFIVNGERNNAYVLVTTSPFQYEGNNYAILILEDISELLQLRALLPICAHCKKIRDDKNYWNHVESYISNHIDVEFSHSICPDCAKSHYPDIFPD